MSASTTAMTPPWRMQVKTAGAPRRPPPAQRSEGCSSYLERALRGGRRGPVARLAGRHHLAERWILGAGRRLFALRLAYHRPRMRLGRQPDPLETKPRYACGMVNQETV
jgi:hypothetical protein